MEFFRISATSTYSYPQLKIDFRNEGVVLTIGTFDGLHVGHQTIMTELKKWGVLYDCPTLVLSFHPAPKAFFLKTKGVHRLMRLREKYDLLDDLGIDFLCLCRFDKALANLSAEDFVTQILIKKLQVKHIVVGEDFRFGKNRQGDVKVLSHLGKRYGFEVSIVPMVMMDGVKVSSTRIREALAEGKKETADKLLGYSH